MADSVDSGWMLRRIDKIVDIAGKVVRPLKFFAAMGFLLMAWIPLSIWGVSDKSSLYVSLVPLVLSIGVIVDLICVLIWAIHKINKDPTAFQDE